jgi:type I site-specific restriction endonuclease
MKLIIFSSSMEKQSELSKQNLKDTLTGVEEQSGEYGKGLLDIYPKWREPLPFAYESTGIETQFTNQLDPSPKSRNVFAFHRPETLLGWLEPNAQLNTRLTKLLTTDNEKWFCAVLQALVKTRFHR